MSFRAGAAVLLATALLSLPDLAHADGVAPLQLDLVDGWRASLGAEANLAGYGAWQSGHENMGGLTASAFAYPKIEKLFENEWKLGFEGNFDLYHDRFSGDNYGNRFFAKAYAFLNTPYGDVELGQQDGAAYKMAVTGPLVAGASAIDDANITFFRDPATGENLSDVFDIRTAVFASANDAKLSYYSPRLLGLQIGVSYTPGLVKDVIPFAASAPKLADRQSSLIDAALNYTGYFGQTSLGAYAGLSAGHNTQRTPGHDDLIDWAIGGELDYDFGGPTLAVGGAWRQTNAYSFDPYQAFAHGVTHAVHGSLVLSEGAWKAGFEYSDGAADAEGALPQVSFTGYELSGAYQATDNLQLTLGWQHEIYQRPMQAFYTGTSKLDLDAVFLYAQVHI